MYEAYLAKLVKKVNDGVPLQDWFNDAEEDAPVETPTEAPEDAPRSFLLIPPRRLWEQVRALPQYKAGISGSGRGRPRRHSPKMIFGVILTKAYGAYRWRELEEMFGIPSTTAYDQYRRWKKAGLFDELHKLRVQCRHGHHDINWIWIKFFDRFRDHLEPEREPKVSENEEDAKMRRLLDFTARRTPRKYTIRAHILRKVRDHFHKAV